ncbi:MAG: outer membrane protein assembly factor BamA [Pseudomonadota bacterium]
MGLGLRGAGIKVLSHLDRAQSIVKIFVIVSAIWLSVGTAVDAQSFRFNSIQIEGNTRIGDAAILQQAGIATGQTLSAGQVNDVVQNLQNSGLFESVAVEPRGNTLLITVVELPTVNRIAFEGNRRVDDDALSAIIQLQERRVFNPSQAERDASAISEAYVQQGRVAARVTPRIIRRSDNRVDVIYEVFEGDTIEIERITFVGNRAYSDRRLRRVLDTKQAGLFRTLIRSDTLVEDRIAFDQQLLRDFYSSRGYVDFRVLGSNAELTEERDGFFLVFNIEEGQQFSFGEITVSSERADVDPDTYTDILKLRPGVTYSPTLVEAELSRLERQGLREGLNFLRVEPRVSRNDRDLTLDVEFVLTRGERVFVERIDIEGNTTTLDQVIRRQFRIAEGDPFNPREIRDAAERIRALGYFSNADVNAREGTADDQVVIDVDVEEQPTGALNFGATFSNNDGFGVAIGFTERNFLGRGQTLGLTLSTAEESERYGINFVEPALLGRDVALGLDLQFSEADSSFTNYDSTSLRFTPSLTFRTGENSSLSLRYTAREDELLLRDGVTPGAVVLTEIGAGEQLASSIGYTYRYDTRNSGLDPNAGVLLEFSQDFAGVGGDSNYIRTVGRVVGQRRVFNEEITLRATLEGGLLAWSSGTNRTIDRFFVGPQILRGFEPGGIGPRDLSSPGEPDPLGGNIYVAARFDMEFPLGLPEEIGLRGGVFYDIGNLYDLDDVDLTGGNVVGESGSFRHVIGFSLFWDTAIGPLRFNFSNALRKEDFDEEQSFDLTLSTQF